MNIDAEKFWARVDRTDECWLWTGSRTTAGYGNLRLPGGRYGYAHRVSYELSVGEIPDGLVIDHLCRVRHCVRPDHLEPVAQVVNVRRGAAGYGPVRDTCKHGHDITDPENVYTAPSGYRTCRQCAREAELKRRNPDWPPTHCPHGHIYDEANTYVTKRGHRQCRACNRINSKAQYARKRAKA